MFSLQKRCKEKGYSPHLEHKNITTTNSGEVHCSYVSWQNLSFYFFPAGTAGGFYLHSTIRSNFYIADIIKPRFQVFWNGKCFQCSIRRQVATITICNHFQYLNFFHRTEIQNSLIVKVSFQAHRRYVSSNGFAMCPCWRKYAAMKCADGYLCQTLSVYYIKTLSP
jgi:hypothetical protein